MGKGLMMTMTPERHAPSKADEMTDTTNNAPRDIFAEQSSGSGVAGEVMGSTTHLAPVVALKPHKGCSASAETAFDQWWRVSGASLAEQGLSLQQLMEAAYCAAEAKQKPSCDDAQNPVPSLGHFAGSSDAQQGNLEYLDLVTGGHCELLGHALGQGTREMDAVLVYRSLEDGGLHYMLPEEFEATKVLSTLCVQMQQEA